MTKSIDKEEICAIGNHTIVTREQVQMYTKFYEITYDKTLSEKKAIAYAKERNALYVAAMQNGYQVTDEQVKAYVEELKQNLDGIWTKEQKEKNCSRVLLRRTITGRLNKRFTGSICRYKTMSGINKTNLTEKMNQDRPGMRHLRQKQNLVDEQQYKDSSSY